MVVLPPGYDPVDAAFDGNLITAEMLRRQLRLLKAHYHVISPEDALAWREAGRELPPRAVLLTCDDGLLNCLTDMLPVLQQEGVSCLFFVTGASAGESRTMLWYEELFLLFLRAPAGPFEISNRRECPFRGELREREERRAIWWNSVKRLSQVAAGSRHSFPACGADSIWIGRMALLRRGKFRIVPPISIADLRRNFGNWLRLE